MNVDLIALVYLPVLHSFDSEDARSIDWGAVVVKKYSIDRHIIDSEVQSSCVYIEAYAYSKLGL
jgi:hypothetical protein